MTDDSRLPDELGLLPADEIWTLLEKYPRIPRTEDGKPAPGSQELHKALDVVYGWMWRREVVLRTLEAEANDDDSAFGPARDRYGLCPKCQSNDGYLWIMEQDQYWAVCHAHRSRWQVSHELIRESFVPDGIEEWEEGERPVSKYWVVQPIEVDCPDDDDEGSSLSTEQAFIPPDLVEKPRLRIVRAGEPGLDSAVAEDREELPGIFRILFVELPRAYVRDLRDRVCWTIGDFVLTPRQLAARNLANGRGWTFLLPKWMR